MIYFMQKEKVLCSLIAHTDMFKFFCISIVSNNGLQLMKTLNSVSPKIIILSEKLIVSLLYTVVLERLLTDSYVNFKHIKISVNKLSGNS